MLLHFFFSNRICLVVFLLFTIVSLNAQQDSLLFSKSSFQIFQSKALFKGATIYDAQKDLQRLIAKEKSNDCPVNYWYKYNPLSLIGNFYSYESIQAGSFACGSPESTQSVQTIDLKTNRDVPLNELFSEESIVIALLSDVWVVNLFTENKISTDTITCFSSVIKLINSLSDTRFTVNGFAILKQDQQNKQIAVRLVGEKNIGYNHSQYIQLGLWLKPKAEFMREVENHTYFLIGQFSNTLSD